MRLMLVDDDRADGLLMVEALGQAAPHVHVEVERTAPGALLRLRREPHIDLVLLDLNMPGDDGFSLLRRIRADAALTATPIVVLTTSAARADVEMAYVLHANAFITKPPDLLQAVDALRRVCDFWCDLALLPGGT